MRADDDARPALAPARRTRRWLARASGTWKIEPMVARTASTENGSTVSPTRITPVGADRVGGADDGAEIAGVADRLRARPRRRSRAGRIVVGAASAAARTRRPRSADCRAALILASTASLTASDVAAARMRARRAAARPAAAFATCARMDERADRPAGLDRVGDELQPLGDEEAALLAVLRRAPARGSP